MGRSHDGLGSPQETPHFPKDFAGFRMTEKKMRKNAFSCCKYPNVGFRVSPSTAIKPKKNGTNTMNKDTNITVQLPTEISYWGSTTTEAHVDRILSNLETMIAKEFSDSPYNINFERTANPSGSGVDGDCEAACDDVRLFIEENWMSAL